MQDSGTDTALLAAIDKHMIASLAALAFSRDMFCLHSYDSASNSYVIAPAHYTVVLHVLSSVPLQALEVDVIDAVADWAALVRGSSASADLAAAASGAPPVRTRCLRAAATFVACSLPPRRARHRCALVACSLPES